MMAVQGGELRMRECGQSLQIPIYPLGNLGDQGPHHCDIGTANKERPSYRGPFRILPAHGVPSHPILWGHQAKPERSIVVEPDCACEVRPGCETLALAVWRTATRLHFNCDFRLNSQRLAACLTPDRALGGLSWPSFRLRKTRWYEAIALWANCMIGLMLFWWAASRKHPGRVALAISELLKLAVLDPRKLPGAKIEQAKNIFKRFRNTTFLPAYAASRDDTRRELD